MWPIDPDVLPRFLAAMAVVELTPGPNMGYLAVISAERGRGAGLSAVAGVTLGLTVYMLAAAFGLTEVLLLYPSLYQGLRWAGVAYLLWLALETAIGRATRPGRPSESAEAGFFWRGLTANLLNPKAAVFYVVMLPNFVDPSRPALVQILTLGAAHVLISVAVHGGIVLASARAASGLGALVQRRAARFGFAATIVLVALWLVCDTR